MVMMYLNHKIIKFLKIKNIIFIFFAVFDITISIYCILSLISYYRDRLGTVLYATATIESIFSTIIAIILLILANKSRKCISDANFYSSYFEHDLDGYIKYGDLAEVTGKSESKVKKQLKNFRRIYMKGYEIRKVQNLEQVVLNSKKCLCECKSCGAPIEKKVYFTGVCSYCGGSDLFAKIIADDKFYSIETDSSGATKKSEFYLGKNIKIKKILTIIILIIIILIMISFSIMCFEEVLNYNNEEYLSKLLLSGATYLSIDLIKKDIINTIIFDIVIIMSLIPVIFKCCKRINYISIAEKYSKYLATSKMSFINIDELPIIKNRKTTIKVIGENIRKRYLLNCTFEKHDDQLKLALAKNIVKDKCTSCSAPIVGAVNENYKCQYCGKLIMGVIVRE